MKGEDAISLDVKASATQLFKTVCVCVCVCPALLSCS